MIETNVKRNILKTFLPVKIKKYEPYSPTDGDKKGKNFMVMKARMKFP